MTEKKKLNSTLKLVLDIGPLMHFIGVGEGVDDLSPFTARDFARAVVGVE